MTEKELKEFCANIERQNQDIYNVIVISNELTLKLIQSNDKIELLLEKFSEILKK